MVHTHTHTHIYIYVYIYIYIYINVHFQYMVQCRSFILEPVSEIMADMCNNNYINISGLSRLHFLE